ncbi:hypothetical protein ACVIHI_009072 [Bradyrhizobium sp. USDA 4524]|uniref:DUF6603 domain-containing protein n=1 Tax=unclassified Bradyrhizobium TaxID=2631580 RepID=UPI0020A0AD84|nr:MULTISPECIES: DUF6603 domain-containing protein [unclassified Bradyrhizobium]MCP1846149.1 hypothetical protein [Bradyrhizobium sp. USDA 4538]MCP1907216.1 hypothetical protein [Bradyrhizobium sp. USDA 4537]MCP1985692.1 hypothetical protein [Bradyrhizobium sp. USDA 4539]
MIWKADSAMPQIATYDALAKLASGLKPGDTLTVGPNDVAPAMLQILEDLTLVFTLSVTKATVSAQPPVVTVEGTTTLFGLADMATTLTFVPETDKTLTGPFLMSVIGSPQQGTEWDLLSNFQLTGINLNFAPNPAIENYDASISCNLVVGAAHSLTMPVTVALPAYPGLDWVITGQFAKQPLSADAFAALGGGLSLSNYLPSPLDTLAKFGLSEIEVAFNPTAGHLSYVFLTITYTDAWSVLGIMDVPADGVALRFMVDFRKTGQSYVELEAQFEIATVPVDIGAHFAPDDFVVWGRLQDGKTVGITDLFKHFKVILPDKFPEIEIDRLSVLASISAGSYDFELVARVDAGVQLKLENLTAKVHVATKPSTVVDASFLGTMVLAADASVFLSAKYDGGGGGLTLVGDAENIPIGTLISYWADRFGISDVPEPISSLLLKTLTISYNTASGDLHFKCVGGFTVHDTAVQVTFTVDLVHTASGGAIPAGAKVGSKGYSATFGGSVTFADLEFDIRFNTKDTGEKIFIADYVDSGTAHQVKLHDLVADVSGDLAKLVPDDVAISLHVVKFAYFKDSGGANRFLFGAELGSEISLTTIPLIGDKLPEDATVKFSQLQFVYSDSALLKDQAASINALFPQGVGGLPAAGLDKGVLVSADLQLGSSHKTISLPIAIGKDQASALLVDARPGGEGVVPAAAPSTASAPASLSINIQKQFGPVAIEKLGLMYDNQVLYVTGDIGLTAQLLSIGLIGLGVGSKITSFSPEVTLSGLTITVDDGPVQVRGGLLGSIHPLNFYGALSVTVPSMSIGALGGYAQLGPDPSFFLYASVNRPLFGYPFFYVDGLAGGLGFNRDLLTPGIDGVAGFPLVSWAMGKDVPPADPSGNIGSQIETVIKSLGDTIPPRVGEYWIAAGIKFSSFSILHSFALLTVSFGTDFKVALLGLTTASLPPDTAAGVPPIGYVEMALEAVFSPDNGILEIAAKVTPASYILTKDCHLTGGVAYYSWFKDNPANDPASYHAGDFVVTLGGYNPAYARPAYFPVEPLLGFNWQVDSNTSIKGGIYFAITPSAMMAGGRLEAVWESGDLKAWFIAHADFLLCWKPFHYEIEIGLSIGVSYKLDLLFTSVTISVSIGVDLSLWGPKFGGTIYVDLSVISFTVGIGNRDKPKARPIPWSEFKTSFLPAPQGGAHLALAAGAPIVTDSYCHSSVAAGLVTAMTAAKVNPTDPDWVVNSETLQLMTFTVFPAKTATLTTAGTKTTPLPTGQSNFGVGPVDVSIDHFTSEHAITIQRLVKGQPDSAFNLADVATIVPVLANIPAATWSGKLTVNPNIGDINKSPANVGGVLVGFSITMKRRPPDHTPLPIDIAILQQESEGTVGFSWTTPTVPSMDSFDQSTAMKTFSDTLVSAKANREAVIGALNGTGLDLGVDADVDIRLLAEQAPATLLKAPGLRYLGEQRAA